MATWAQIVGGVARDVCGGDDSGPAIVPGYDPHGVGWTRVPDGTQSGATDNGNGTFTNPAAPAPESRILSKTAFQDYAVSQLGGGATGMARFTDIMDATRDSASGAVRFAFARYEAALTFEKANTAALTSIMAADTQTGHLTSAERTAIIDNWPTS